MIIDPLYGPDGHVVAWLDDETIYLLHGRALAFLRRENVVSYSGRHLGVFHDGWLRDHGGYAIAFVSGAGPGPTKPVRSVAPVRPVRYVRPVHPVAPVPPVPAVRQLAWSRRSFSDWGAGQ